MAEGTVAALPATLILVRHGHVQGITPERFRGRTNLELTTLGVKQAGETADFIASNWAVDAIYASPLMRCMNTAEAIATKQNKSVQPLDQLIDIDYGSWQGQATADVAAQQPELYQRWLSHPAIAVVPGAETLADVQARCVRAFDLVSKQVSGGTALAVGHDSTIRIFLSLLLDLPLSAYWRIKQDPCAINVLKFDAGAYQLCCLNSTAHLTGA